MDLDDLRRQWQQPAPPGPALNPQQLSGWLARGSGSLVATMRRNARLEAAFTLVLILAFAAALPWLPQQLQRVEVVGALLLLLAVLYLFYRALTVLGRMAIASGDVRGHLQTLCAGMRQVVRLYYSLSLATGPTMLMLAYGFLWGRDLARPDGPRLLWLLELGGVLLLLGGLLQVAVAYSTRWYLRRLYGQHLDRLEADLRELDEAAR